MLFNSYGFLLLFLPITLLLWWRLPTPRARLLSLAAMSSVFYGVWDPRFVPLMLVASVADWFAGRAIVATEDLGRRRLFLVALLVFNLGLLGLFKYWDFLATSVNGVLLALAIPSRLPLLALVLPVGISFYTFNSISYTIDVYRRRVEPSPTMAPFMAFVTMFPHLVAGPIVRWADMKEQFSALPPRPTSGAWTVGLWFLGVGFAKKLLLADPLNESLVAPLWAGASSLDFVSSWLAALSYTFQLYFDFSGYSDMAVGLALLLGLRFPQNFDSPYRSKNPSEFWKRWHISLSFWLRDYLFISMGGSREGESKTIRNLVITMFLGGLWHGAAWTFVAWGLYHGALLALHAVGKRLGLLPRSALLSQFLCFGAVVIGWVIFRAPDLTTAGQVLLAMVGLSQGSQGAPSPWGLSLLLLCAGISFFAPNSWEVRWPRSRASAVLLALIFAASVLKFAKASPFLYFQF